MRLISLKTCKVPAIVICMLAAGICYSCGGHPDPSVGSGYEGIVLELGDSGSGQDGLGNPGSGKDEPGEFAGMSYSKTKKNLKDYSQQIISVKV